MAINDIVQTIAEARVDARSLSEFVFKPAGFKVARRLAPTVDTLQFYIDRFDATKAATDAYVATIPTIVNNAINNTAVEGGVLADTFLTVENTINQRQVNRGFESVDEMLNIANPKDGLRIYVKSYHAGLSVGGGYFTYDSTKANVNDQGVTINGWVRQFDGGEVSPCFFGAIPTSESLTTQTTNNLAFQSAADYAQSRGLIFKVGAGSWLISETINFTRISANYEGVIIRGVGKSSGYTGVVGSHIAIRSNTDKSIFHIEGEMGLAAGMQGAHISSLSFSGQGSGKHVAISMRYAYYSDISDLKFRFIHKGLELHDGYGTRMRNLITGVVGVGVHLTGSCGAISIVDSNLRWCNKDAENGTSILLSGDGAVLNITNVDVEGSPYGIRTDDNSTGRMIGVHITSLYSETQSKRAVKLRNIQGLIIESSTFLVALPWLELSDSSNVELINCFGASDQPEILNNVRHFRRFGNYKFERPALHAYSESRNIKNISWNAIPDPAFIVAANSKKNYPIGMMMDGAAATYSFVAGGEELEEGKKVWKIAATGSGARYVYWEIRVPHNLSADIIAHLSAIIKTSSDRVTLSSTVMIDGIWQPARTTTTLSAAGVYVTHRQALLSMVGVQRVRIGFLALPNATYWVDRVAFGISGGSGLESKPLTENFHSSGTVTLVEGVATLPLPDLGFGGSGRPQDSIELTARGDANVWWELNATSDAVLIKGSADIKVSYKIFLHTPSLYI